MTTGTIPALPANRNLGTQLSVSATSAQTAALSGADILFWSGVAVNVLFGTNPTATAAGIYVPANTVVRFVNVKAGDKLAALAGGAGTAYYLEA